MRGSWCHCWLSRRLFLAWSHFVDLLQYLQLATCHIFATLLPPLLRYASDWHVTLNLCRSTLTAHNDYLTREKCQEYRLYTQPLIFEQGFEEVRRYSDSISVRYCRCAGLWQRLPDSFTSPSDPLIPLCNLASSPRSLLRWPFASQCCQSETVVLGCHYKPVCATHSFL